MVVSSSGSQTATGTGGTGDDIESMSSKSDTSLQNPVMSPSSSVSITAGGCASPIVNTGGGFTNGNGMDSPRPTSLRESPVAVSTSPPVSSSDGLRRVALGPSQRRARTHAVVIQGPPGYVFVSFQTSVEHH